jgi:cathepsin X
MSYTRNERIPTMCDSSWALATTSAISDRINIARNRTWPDQTISPQVVINCKAGGSCSGGNPFDVYAYGYRAGLP